MEVQIGHFIILALATWRIASLLQFERGPGAMFTRLRGLLGIKHDEDGKPTSWPDTEPGRLLACIRCGSIWAGAGLVGLYAWSPLFALGAAAPFAISAGAILVEAMTDGKGDG